MQLFQVGVYYINIVTMAVHIESDVCLDKCQLFLTMRKRTKVKLCFWETLTYHKKA